MNKIAKKKLILATGIFPPDVGGPSTYVFALAKEMIARGWEVVVVTYFDEKISKSKLQITNNFKIQNSKFKIVKISRQQNIIFRYFKYFLAVLKNSKEARAVLAFDLTSSGLPAFFGAKLRRKKIFVRMGGDFLWEKAFSKNWTDLPLEKYYKKKKSFKEKLYFILNRFFIKRFSGIIFTNDWMKKIYQEYYRVKEEKSVVIKNPYPSIEKNNIDRSIDDKKMIFAGRLIKLKNLDRVIKAISSIPEIKFDIYGEGPEKENLKKLIVELDLGVRVRVREKLTHEDFMIKLQKSYFSIVPSVTEVSPNTLLECIKLGVPVLATKECGLYDDYKDDLIFFDPMDSNDIRKKIRLILKQDVYNAYQEGMCAIDASRGFGDVAEEIGDMIELSFRGRVAQPGIQD